MPLGGQAVIEGVVITDGKNAALAVRRPDDSIALETLAVPSFPRLERLLFLRGLVRLYQILSLGFRALARSAEIAYPEEKSSPWSSALAIGLASILLLGGFIALPFFLARYTGLENNILLNLVEGGIRVSFFILYLWAVSLFPDIQRVFQYHGAEHKAVHAYEAGTPEVSCALGQSPLHARCGTNFVFLFVVVAILVFSLVPVGTFWARILLRIGFIPVVASITYEILQLGAKTRALRPFLWPGFLFQKLTVRKPTPDQIEVALAALQQVLQRRSSSTNA